MADYGFVRQSSTGTKNSSSNVGDDWLPGGKNPEIANWYRPKTQQGQDFAQKSSSIFGAQNPVLNTDGSLKPQYSGQSLMPQSLRNDLNWYTPGNTAKLTGLTQNVTPIYNMTNQDREFVSNNYWNSMEAQRDLNRDAGQMDLAWAGQDLQERTLGINDRQFGETLGYNKWATGLEDSTKRHGIDTGSQDTRYVTDANNAANILIGDARNRTSLNIANLDNDTAMTIAGMENAVASEANVINRLSVEGRITNDMAQRAFENLRLKLDDTYRWGELRQQGEQFGQNLDQRESEFSRQMGFSREELAATQQWRDVQAQLQREQMEEAYRTAVMQAVGRNQAQNARWVGY